MCVRDREREHAGMCVCGIVLLKHICTFVQVNVHTSICVSMYCVYSNLCVVYSSVYLCLCVCVGGGYMHANMPHAEAANSDSLQSSVSFAFVSRENSVNQHVTSFCPSPVCNGVRGVHWDDVAAAPILPPSTAVQTHHQSATPAGPQGQLYHD